VAFAVAVRVVVVAMLQVASSNGSLAASEAGDCLMLVVFSHNP
jgi:hypothetical protein